MLLAGWALQEAARVATSDVVVVVLLDRREQPVETPADRQGQLKAHQLSHNVAS
jgi:hypothetical protein